MRINDPALSGINVTGQTQGSLKTTSAERVNAQTGAGAASGGSDAGDAVQLSELAKSLKALDANSAEREARVEELAKAVQSGSYQTDPAAIASSLVESGFEPASNGSGGGE